MASYTANPDELAFGDVPVVSGVGWMREAAIQYDPADTTGNTLLVLDQVDTGAGTGILRINAMDGSKVRQTLDQSTLSTPMRRPVDFQVVGTEAFILDGDTPRLIAVDDITAGTPVLTQITDCTNPLDELALMDPVAFAVNPAATGDQPKFFVADRGSKEIILISANNDCTVLPTLRATEVDDPRSDDEEVTVLVPDPKPHLPIDIAYHAGSETLFVSGRWFFTGNVVEVDDSGNAVVDSSGNEVLREISIPQSFQTSSFLYKIELGELDASGNPNDDLLHRQPVSYVSEDGPTDEDDPDDTVFFVNAPESLMIDGDQLYVIDGAALSSLSVPGLENVLVTLGGVLVADVSDDRPRPTDSGATPMVQPNDYVFTPVSGAYFGRNVGTSVLGNPLDLDFTPLIGVASFAKQNDQMITLSPEIGSYIGIDLADASTDPECISFIGDAADPDNANRIQCDFDGTRTLVPGGGSVRQVDDSGNEIYAITGRANFDPSILGALTNSGGPLALDRRTGEFWVNGTVQQTLYAEQDNIGLLFSEAKAIISDVSSIYAIATTFEADENCVATVDDACIPVEQQQLIQFSSSDQSRTVVEPEGAGAGVDFADAVASVVVPPRVFSADIGDLVGDDLDNRLQEIVLNRDLFVADSTFESSGTLVQVELDTLVLDETQDPPEAVDNEDRGTRTLFASNCPGGNLGAVTAMTTVGFTSNDVNDDGELTTQGTGDFNEADGLLAFDTLSLLLLLTDNNEVLAIDLLNGTCEPIASYPTAVISLQVTEGQAERDENDGTELGAVLRRTFRLMALDANNHTLYELECEENDPINMDGIVCGTPGSGAPVSGPALALGLNASDGTPIDATFMPQPATFTFNSISRFATIIDDRVNARFTSDLSFREDTGPGAGGPTDVEDDPDLSTRQTVITGFGSPINCDPENFEAACRNL